MKQHRYSRNTFPNRPVSQRITEILSLGYPDVEYQIIQDNLTEDISYTLEIKTIQLLGRVDNGSGILLNRTDGGEGWSKGRKWDENTFKKRKAHYKENPRGSPVDQHTLSGEYLATFPSANHATRILNLLPNTNSRIRLCCRGKSLSACGFMWTYAGEEAVIIPKKSRRSISQFSKQGEHIRDFDSISEASILLSINAGDISNMCKTNRYKSVGGYIWRYTT